MSNLLLTFLNGDYDGDVLNFIFIFGKEFNDLFSKFKPTELVLDYNTCKFNTALLPNKDTALGLETMLAY